MQEPNRIEDMKILVDRLTDLRIEVARISEQLTAMREDRADSFKSLSNKVDRLEVEVKSLDKKITYASGMIVAISVMFSMLAETFLKKIGLTS